MQMDKTISHLVENDTKPGESLSITYKFSGSAGPSMMITVTVDEFNVVSGMFINVASSGSTVHNVCNALARVVSIAIQNDKATLLQIVQTMEMVKSEVVWISTKLGKADSIPAAISLVLLRHVELEATIDQLHTGEE